MPRSRYTDPVENLLSYIMVHGGIDRHERMADVEWVREVVKAAEKVRSADERHASTDLEDAISELRGALQR